MGNQNIILLISSLLIACFLLPSSYSYSTPQVTNVRVYQSGNFNPSHPPEYGDVLAFQDILKDGPDLNSSFLGNAQGTIAFADNQQGSLYDFHVSLSYVFRSGEYNGSTVVAVGKCDLTQATREFAIVGGTGVFKLARGIVMGGTFPEDPTINIYDLEIIQDTVQATHVLD